MTREYRATLSIDQAGSRNNEYQYLISALVQSEWIYLETSVLMRVTGDINDIWEGLALVMKQSAVMDPLSHLSLDIVSSEDFSKGVPYAHSEEHRGALDNVRSKPYPI